MINRQLDEKIRAWIQAHREELTNQWMDLIRIPSVGTEGVPGAPYGEPCAQVLETAGSYFAKEGFEVTVESGNHYAYADLHAGEKTIGMFSHCDVVPAADGWVYTKPFEPIIKDGYMIGRGCSDDKSGVMIALAVMRIIKELKLPVKSSIRTYLGPAEEIRMPDMVMYKERELIPDLSLVPDSAFPCCLGEKTIYRFKAECARPMEAILDFNGGTAQNIVLEKATVILRKLDGLAEELAALIEGKKEYSLCEEWETLVLKTVGSPKHAAHPEGSVNGAVLAAAVLKECKTLPQTDRDCVAQLYGWICNYYGEGLGIAFEDPAFGKLTSSNGLVWMREGHLAFGMDIRFGTALDHLETEKFVTELLKKQGWEMTYVLNRKGYLNDPSSPIPSTLTDIYNEITGLQTKPYYMAGGTYGRHLKNAFVVGVSAYDPESKAVRPEMPEGHGGAHQRDECISVDGHFQAVRTMVHYLLACDEYLNG